MKIEKYKHGGKRAGAGRKAQTQKTNPLQIRVSDQTLSYLDYYASNTDISKSQLADLLIFNSLASGSNDFAYCPQCEKPVLYKPIIFINDDDCIIPVKCNCGHTFEVEV